LPDQTVWRYRGPVDAGKDLSAVRLAGDINATVTDNASLDELLAKIKDELRKLGPLIDLEARPC
jgi:hypothetical protein